MSNDIDIQYTVYSIPSENSYFCGCTYQILMTESGMSTPFRLSLNTALVWIE